MSTLAVQQLRKWGERGALLLLMLALYAGSATAAPDEATMRQWLAEMRENPRGPFDAIRWYCKDGKVRGAKEGCAQNGGGVQHGQWSAQARALRAAGYPVANLLVEIKPEEIAGPRAQDDLLQMVLLERFLVAFDDGWIFRKAQSYRGAVQDDDERESARKLLHALVQDGDTDYLLIREAARLLPHGADTPQTAKVRAMAVVMDEKDPRFHALRSRIHNAPEYADAQRVREYAAKARPELRDDYEDLARSIESAYRPPPLAQVLGGLTRWVSSAELKKMIDEGVPEDPSAAFTHAAVALAWLRANLDAFRGPEAKLAAIDASLNAEVVMMAAASALQPQLARASRAERLAYLNTAGTALQGLGFLNERESAELGRSLAELPNHGVRLAAYRETLEYLDRAPSWATHRLEYHFGEAVAKLSRIEPLAAMFIPDRLRGSPLLFYSAVLQSLREDADHLTGVHHDLFGKRVSGQLRRLNPGIARGVLRVSAEGPAPASPAIYLVPETTADLPPAAGILTEAEGNPLSHVQILARNLGIPNVVVDPALAGELRRRDNRHVVIAASPGGLVQIAEDGPRWRKILDDARAAERNALILATPAKLELWRRDVVSTANLRAADSGRLVGPKAAQVGELERAFPDHVSPGLALPFGIHAQLLQQPVRAGGPPMQRWLRDQYAQLAVQRGLDPEGHGRRVKEMLDFTRGWMQSRELPEAQREALRSAMFERFGMEGTYGVFVRSDTNVEDLPGFTGAGLNLTVPNVVGFDAVVAALKQVWASPFTERAYGWRQDLMDQPEHVYVSILLHKSVPNAKSGVMVTADIDSGARDVLTVATNLGVGGGVDGQAAESLRIPLKGGEPRLLASATARWQRLLPGGGGVAKVRAPAPQAVLSQEEIDALRKFARELPRRYPQLLDAEGEPAPADVEFGFAHGRLVLLQIRPFLQNRAAQQQQYLAGLDKRLQKADGRRVDLSEAPGQAS